MSLSCSWLTQDCRVLGLVAILSKGFVWRAGGLSAGLWVMLSFEWEMWSAPSYVLNWPVSKTTPTMFWPFPLHTLSGCLHSLVYLIQGKSWSRCFLILNPHFRKGKRNTEKRKYVTACCWKVPASCLSASSYTQNLRRASCPSEGGRWLGQHIPVTQHLVTIRWLGKAAQLLPGSA